MSLYSLSFGGILPIGSILAGVLADATSTTAAIGVMSASAGLIGLVSPRLRVPSVNTVASPEFSERPRPTHDTTVAGGPVIVLNAWQIEETDLGEFTALMNEVRLIRLSTGAHRWNLMRNATDPLRIVEVFEIRSWEEHLSQHGRIDDSSAATIGKARAFDTGDGPTTRHLIAIDPENPELLVDLIRQHEDLHRIDGSIPTFDQDG